MTPNKKPVSDPAIWLAGYIPDLPTPFDANGEIDIAAFARLCERQIRAGVTAIVIGETAGEFSTLTSAERETLIRTAASVSRRRVRVIAGAGSNSTQRAIELARLAEGVGADAILSVVPYYNKPMQAGIEAHFQAIAAATPLPVILHDIPSRTVKGLSDDTVARLAESPQFIGICDGTGDAAHVLRLRSRLRRSFRLLCGDDALALAYFACGGVGCVSRISNIMPDYCHDIFRHCQQGRHSSAADIQAQLLPLISALARKTPAALKYALYLLGLASPHVRLPMVELDDADKATIMNLMRSPKYQKSHLSPNTSGDSGNFLALRTGSRV